MDLVRDMKTWCLTNPENYLWRGPTRNMQEVHNIFYKINELQYKDKPDYEYIHEQLTLLLQKEECTNPSVDTRIIATVTLAIYALRREVYHQSLA